MTVRDVPSSRAKAREGASGPRRVCKGLRPLLLRTNAAGRAAARERQKEARHA
jgi:hypothetical protein